MIVNGADEFRSQLGKARGSIARARAPSAVADPLGSEHEEPLETTGAIDDEAGSLSIVR